MMNWCKHSLLWGLTLVGIALCSLPLMAQSLVDDLDEVHEDISNWQIPQAKQKLDALIDKGQGDKPQVLFARGRLAFFQSDYKASLDLIDQALTMEDDANLQRSMKSLRGLAQVTWDTTKHYKTFTSDSGRFILRIEAGKDEIVVPYAFETLENAYERLGKVFGHQPPIPVVVEMYPTAATLAAVSPLTEENIKNSGTIALCKYNRLMFTSPKALLKGYSWRDTMSHEFAHLAITQKSNNTVPIWMHEGLAKYLERLWRPEQKPLMQPASENLLTKGIKDDKLITFEQMHPSMAKLPDQESTALAFAEVYTVMEYLEAKKGRQVFSELLSLMRTGVGAEKAMEELLGMPFATFQRQWTGYLKQRPSKAFDEELVNVDKLVFHEDKEGSELLEIGKKEARDMVHIGELLQARKRYKAAVIEYRKARELIGDRNPILQTRLGRSLIVLKQYQEAVDALAYSLDYYPNYHNTHALLGEALLELGRLPEAEVHLLEAVGINPFDPKPHQLLARLYTAQGEADLATQARRFAQMAGG